MQNKIIKEIPITKKSKLVISTVELAKKLKLDIRIWILGKNKKNNNVEEFFPIWKGVNIPINKRNEIIEGLKMIPEPDSCEEG